MALRSNAGDAEIEPSHEVGATSSSERLCRCDGPMDRGFDSSNSALACCICTWHPGDWGFPGGVSSDERRDELTTVASDMRSYASDSEARSSALHVALELVGFQQGRGPRRSTRAPVR